MMPSIQTAVKVCDVLQALSRDNTGAQGAAAFAVAFGSPPTLVVPHSHAILGGLVGTDSDGRVVIIVRGLGQPASEWQDIINDSWRSTPDNGIAVMLSLDRKANAFKAAAVAAGVFSLMARGYLLAGHSAGGAVVSILAMQLRRQGVVAPMEVITFGRPKVMSAAGEAAIAADSLDLAGNDDPVVVVPPSIDAISGLSPAQTGVLAGSLVTLNPLLPAVVAGCRQYAQPTRRWLGDDGDSAPPNDLAVLGLVLNRAVDTQTNQTLEQVFGGHLIGTYKARLAKITIEEGGIPMWPNDSIGEALAEAIGYYVQQPPTGTTVAMWSALQSGLAASADSTAFAVGYQALLTAATVNNLCGVALTAAIFNGMSVNQQGYLGPAVAAPNGGDFGPGSIPITSNQIREAVALGNALSGAPTFLSLAQMQAWQEALRQYAKLGGTLPNPLPLPSVPSGAVSGRSGLPVGYPTYVIPAGSQYRKTTYLPDEFKAFSRKIEPGNYGIWWGLGFVGSASHRKTGRRVARRINELMQDLGLLDAVDASNIVGMLQYTIIQGTYPMNLLNGIYPDYQTA